MFSGHPNSVLLKHSQQAASESQAMHTDHVLGDLQDVLFLLRVLNQYLEAKCEVRTAASRCRLSF